MESVNGFVAGLLENVMVWGSVALGLGFVIFIHELGHFLLAKWNGVKVETFALGLPLGPTLVSFRKGIGFRFGSTRKEYHRRLEEAQQAGLDPEATGLGETEYIITSVPLGGFVSMLGEGEGNDSEEVKSSDPRAYPNKPVGARMAIISAGVIMNVILGMIAFSVVYGSGGLPVMPARIGGVVAGHPGYLAGLRTGDEVIAINDHHDVDFRAMRRMTAMSGPDEALHLTIKRAGVDQPLSIDVEPLLQAGAPIKTMGVLQPDDTALAQPPFLAPAGWSGPAPTNLKPGDRIVAIGPEGQAPEPVSDAFQLRAVLARLRDKPIVLQLERPERAGSAPEQAPHRFELTLPAVPFVDLGFRPTLGAVTAIQPGSPAASAGFRVGDRIVAVADVTDFDPIRLPNLIEQRAGQPTEIKVIRSEGGKPEEALSLTATPSDAPIWSEPTFTDEPLEVPGLGLAVAISPIVAHVQDGSEAALAGLKPGDRLEAITIQIADTRKPDLPTEPEDLPLEGKNAASWAGVFGLLQLEPRHDVLLKVAGREQPIRISPRPAPDFFNPERGLRFAELTRPLPPLGLLAAIQRGTAESLEAIQDVYLMFRNLLLGEIRKDSIGGPIMIADIASQQARAGWLAFVQFLGILSLNLAVINFFPVPPLDGGQMVFLIAEKLRGKPLPDKARTAGSLVGFVLVCGLMLFVMVQDIQRYFPWGK